MVSASAISRFATATYFGLAGISRPPLDANGHIGVDSPEATVALADYHAQTQRILRQALVIAARDDAHRNEHRDHQKQQSDTKRRTREQRPDGRDQHAATDHQEWHERYSPQHRWPRAALKDGILERIHGSSLRINSSKSACQRSPSRS